MWISGLTRKAQPLRKLSRVRNCIAWLDLETPSLRRSIPLGHDYFPRPSRAPAVHVASTVSIMAVLHRRETALGIFRRRNIAELHIGFALRVFVPGWFWASLLLRLCIHGVSNIRHPTWQSIREASDFDVIKDNCRRFFAHCLCVSAVGTLSLPAVAGEGFRGLLPAAPEPWRRRASPG